MLPLLPCMSMPEASAPDWARRRLWAFRSSAMLSEGEAPRCIDVPLCCRSEAASAGMVAKASVTAAAAATIPESRISGVSLCW
jgi:hypothetical protein